MSRSNLYPTLILLLLGLLFSTSRCAAQPSLDQVKYSLAKRLREAEIEPTQPGIQAYLRAMRPNEAWEQDVARLIRKLASKSFRERQQATRALSTMPLPPLRALRKALEDANTEVTYRSRRILAEIGRGRHESRLRQVLLFIRSQSMKGLTKDLLGASLIWDDPLIRWDIARTIQATWQSSDEALVQERIKTGKPNEQIVAMLTLALVKPDGAIGFLSSLPKSLDPWYRLAVAEALANFGSPTALPRLIAELDNESEDIQRVGLEYIEALTGKVFNEEKTAERVETCKTWWKTAPANLAIRYPLFDAMVGRYVLAAGGRIASEAVDAGPPRWLRHYPHEGFRLRQIDLSQAQISPQILARLQALPELQSLSFQGARINDEQMAQFGDLIHLRSLSLRGCHEFTDVGMASLRRMPSLDSLDLGETRITSLSLKALGASKQLRSLDLSRCRNIEDNGFDAITEMEGIETLNLEGTNVSGLSLAKLQFLPRLVSLQIGKLTTDGVLDQLNLAKLRTLKISHATVTGKGLAQLAKNTKLERLELYRCNSVADAGMEAIGNMTSLRELVAICPEVTDNGIQHLQRLENLETLVLTHTKITGRGAQALQGLSKLSKLEAGHTQIDDEGLKHLGMLTSLRELHLRNSKITDAGLEHLQKLANLTRLVLDGNAVTGSGLGGLSTLEKLTELSLYNVRLRSDALGDISKLQSLKDLDISNTPIGDQVLPLLDGLDRLERLNLSKTTISDAGLSALRKLDKLREVNVRLTRVTQPAMDAFTAKHPQVTFYRSYTF